MQRISAVLGALCLVLASAAAAHPLGAPRQAVGVRRPTAPVSATPPATTAVLRSAALPVPPPAWARPVSKEVPPAQEPSSPYLQMRVWSYAAAGTAQEVYAYYAPRITDLGYTANASGQSCQVQIGCAPFWAFQRGQNDTIVLTVALGTGGPTRYSLTLQRIVPPPRAKESVVPADAQSVTVARGTAGGAFSLRRTVTALGEVRTLREIVNRLPVDTRGVHGCLADTGARAEVIFRAPQGTLTFLEDPACDSVSGPGKAALTDPGYRLWDAVSKLLGQSTRFLP